MPGDDRQSPSSHTGESIQAATMRQRLGLAARVRGSAT